MSDKALLLGINNYATISDLSGCVNDVNNIKRLLTEQYAFQENLITTITDTDVTKENLIEGFDQLLSGANSGDRLVFHFSGHGSYKNSDNDDEEVDELICLHDMDWDDPDSYLLDDDLGRMLDRVPQGVAMTVIIDSCHSGNGTRAITKRGTLASRSTSAVRLMVLEDTLRFDLGKQGQRALRSLREGEIRSENPVIARFVQPPTSLRVQDETRRDRGRFVTNRTLLNHQLLAGAADNQTAADAFINGSYNGAFSYYLCDSARSAGRNASTQSIFDSAVVEIKNKNFSQDPQLEGPFGSDPLFGQDDDGESGGTGGGTTISIPKNLSGSEDISRLVNALEKLVEIKYHELGLGSGMTSRSVGDEVWVAVHGISRHSPGYSVEWFNAQNPFLTKNLQCEEVLWSDIVNERSVSITRSQREEMERERAVIEAIFQERIDEVRRESGSTRSVSRGSSISIDDFLRYMFVESVRNRILDRFYDVVEPLLEAGRKVHLITHSWGTVVSYEGLRELERKNLSGRVANFFVVGSALSISAVRANLFSRQNDGRKPALVDNWINLDAKRDIVGGDIRPDFQIPASNQFLDLDPVNCGLLNLVCSHSSYFDPDNTATNRDIFAKFINR